MNKNCPVCKIPLINNKCNNFIFDNYEQNLVHSYEYGKMVNFTNFSILYGTVNHDMILSYYLCLPICDKIVEIYYSLIGHRSKIHIKFENTNSFSFLKELNYLIDPFDPNLINKIKTIINFS